MKVMNNMDGTAALGLIMMRRYCVQSTGTDNVGKISIVGKVSLKRLTDDEW